MHHDLIIACSQSCVNQERIVRQMYIITKYIVPMFLILDSQRNLTHNPELSIRD